MPQPQINTHLSKDSGNSDFPDLITRREVEILHWSAAGKSNAEQALILGISANTVNYHLKNIYQKLSVSNRAAAVSTASNMGLIFVDNSGHKKIIQDIYKSFVEGDLLPFIALLSDETEWISTAPQSLFPHAGLYKGVDAIMGQLAVIGTIYETKRFLPRIFVEENSQIAVYLDVSLIHRANQNQMLFDVAHFWTFKQRKVARYVEIFNSAIAQGQQFGGNSNS